MNIHEYQAKELLRQAGLPVPLGFAAHNMAEAAAAADKLLTATNQSLFVVKAQIHAGGRGAGHFKDSDDAKGGVRVVRDRQAVEDATHAMLHHCLVTKQTGAAGREVKTIYVEQGAAIASEFYLSLLVDRASGGLMVVVSAAGGMNIEDVAAETPEKIIKESIAWGSGFTPAQLSNMARLLNLPATAAQDLSVILDRLLAFFIDKDCSLIEINPLVLTKDGDLLLLDAKIAFDDNALFRHDDIARLRDKGEEDEMEAVAREHDLSYVKLDGAIGCMVNGAGLAMATMDIIKQKGGSPANFLDVGGGATAERVKVAFGIILSDKNVRGILVNIFGGIMRCDIIANGIIAAIKETQLAVPLVVRLEGTNVKAGKEILARSGLNIIAADDLEMAADKIVAAVKEQKA